MNGEAVLEIFPRVNEAIEEGRMLDAWNMAQTTGVPLQDWPDGEPLRQAARLASALGANRLSRAMHWKNWRQRRDDPSRYYHALFARLPVTTAAKLFEETLAFSEKHPHLLPANRADLQQFQAWVHIMQRDFGPAERLLDEALNLQPEDSWLRTERSSFFAAADRYEEALEEALEAVRLAPCYRPAVTRCSEALVHLGKDDEALALLMRAHGESQQAAFASAMQVIFSERQDHERGLWCLAETERLSPLMEPSVKKWLASRRADFFLIAGNLDEFLIWADQAGDGFQKRAAENLRREGGMAGVRKRLEVPFVRQHRSTCGPATLAAIAAYWGRPHDHLEIADAICYEGTPWHKERGWAEGHGFVTKEFRLTRDSLQALIDRGVPFTLTTQWTTGAHLQACIGYDTRTDVLLLRDPTERHFGEMLISGLLESHPLAGPRAMVMVPADRADLLDGVPFADDHVYDSVHHLRAMLETHDRFKTEAALVQLRAVAPDHLLALDGELRFAQTFEDWPRALAAVDALLERLPDYESLWLTKCSVLYNSRRSPDYRKELERIVAKPKADAVFLSDLGELLLEDARELTMADYYLRRALGRGGAEARIYENLGRCRMKERRFVEAARLRRAASCLAPTFEPYASGYFETTRIIGKTSEGLEYLEERTRKLGDKDQGPWITYVRALDSVNRSSEAAAVLEKAASLRPDDGPLLLQGGRFMTAWGPDFCERGLELMKRSRGLVRESLWLRESAEVAGFLGDRISAIGHWRALLKLQPEQIHIWRSLARLIAEEEGRVAAIALLDDGTERHPQFADLWALAAEWLAATPRGPLAVLDRYLELEPRSAWGFRERALRRMQRDQHEAALADAREALDLDPFDPLSPYIHGLVLQKMGSSLEAAENFRKAITLSVDATDAPDDLMSLATERQAGVDALRFIESEMRRQVSDGTIVLRFQRLAWRWIDPPELLKKLQDFCRERPDLWQTWSARITQALRMEIIHEAKISATAMTRNFPLMPRAWLDSAKVHEAAGEIHEAVRATSKAVDIAPGWDEAARIHAEALERVGKPQEAELALRKAVFHEPLSGANHGYLADLVRRMGRHREAVDLLREAMKICPFYGWGWTMLARWSAIDGRKEEIIADLENASKAQGHHRSWWPIASDAWAELKRNDEAISYIRRGIEMDPENHDLRDQLAALLCSDHQFDAALAACDLPNGEVPPTNLQGRRAWILMRAGQPVQAIKEMRDLLDRQPDYIWVLAELTGWLSSRGDWKATLEIATRWARQAPQESRAFGYIGQAEENLADTTSAVKAYSKALMLQPDYSFAGRQLLDLQMKARNFGEAADTLRRLQYYVPSVWVDCDAIELELRASKFQQALDLTDQLLNRTDADFDVMSWVQKMFLDHGWDSKFHQLLDRRLKEGNAVAPGALAVSIGQIPSNEFSRQAYKRVKNQPVGSAIRIAGWCRMLDLAAKLKQKRAIVKWSKKHRQEFVSDGRLWRETGGAFLTLQDFGRGAAWLADWPDRPADVNSETLLWVAALNDGATARDPKYWTAAKAARLEALARFPHEDTSGAFRGSLAFQQAVDGEIEDARAMLADFEPGLISNFYQNYGNAAMAIVAAADGDEKTARAKLTAVSDFFSKIDEEIPAKILKRSYTAVASHIPWTRNSGRRLRKKWALRTTSKKQRFSGFENLNRGWIVWIVIFILVQLLRFCGDTH